MSYERALYLKCLNNELVIPPSLIAILKRKGLLSEGEEQQKHEKRKRRICLPEGLVSDVTNAEESNISRRPSKLSVGGGSNVDESKSVKFASSSSSLTKSSSRNKTNSTSGTVLGGAQPEEVNTISTIRTLLQ